MPLFEIETKITGTAYATVVAESEAMARDMLNQGEVEFEITDWDISTEAYLGGYVDIALSNQVCPDDPFTDEMEGE
jgi:CO/xanthine dehydrogenase Mo-binding subunit